MRALEICYFVICLNIAIPLVAATGIFGVGPTGTSNTTFLLLVGGAVVALTVGGISIMGWSFKTPAVITTFAAIYGASVAIMDILIVQIISSIADPNSLAIAATFAGVLTTICAVIGVQGAMQLAGGAFGSMD